MVDQEGIHERCRSGQAVSIRWHELDSLSSSGARSETGTRISLRLSPARRREFVNHASEIWKVLHPDRWQRNRERARRAANWAVYFWFPLLTLGPCIACYMFFWTLGWPESLLPEVQKLHRLTAFGLISVTGLVVWYGYKTRKAA